MAYHGVREVRDNKYLDKTIRSGVYYWKAHIYTCDHCGQELRVRFKAEESFFCHCNRLVSLENHDDGTTRPHNEEAGRLQAAGDCLSPAH